MYISNYISLTIYIYLYFVFERKQKQKGDLENTQDISFVLSLSLTIYI